MVKHNEKLYTLYMQVYKNFGFWIIFLFSFLTDDSTKYFSRKLIL